MILYVDETADSRKAVEMLRPIWPELPIAPSEGRGLPEFVLDGYSHVGIGAIKRFLDEHAHQTGEK